MRPPADECPGHVLNSYYGDGEDVYGCELCGNDFRVEIEEVSDP